MIYDANENPITSTALTIAPDDEKTFTLLVDCLDGYEITAAADNADVGIFARADPGDAWSDIIAAGLDVSAFEPQRKTFYFKIEVDTGADPSTEIVQIIVSRP